MLYVCGPEKSLIFAAAGSTAAAVDSMRLLHGVNGLLEING